MEENELTRAVAQAVGQALGEMSVGTAVALLALTNAISKQPGVDPRKLFQDILADLPDVQGAAQNVVDVMRQALGAAVSGDATAE